MELFEQIAGIFFLALLTPFMIVIGIFVTVVAAAENFVKYVIRRCL
jgi:hypothetical protein